MKDTAKISINQKKSLYQKISPETLRTVELDILFRLKCPYLIKAHKLQFDDSGIGYTLQKHKSDLRDEIKLTQKTAKQLVASLTYGLSCLHSKNFIHGNIQPKHCLYQKTKNGYDFYLADYSSVMISEEPEKGILVNNEPLLTRSAYSDPNMLSSAIDKENILLNTSTDIWALGVTFLYAFGFRYPKLNKNEKYFLEWWTSEDRSEMIKSVIFNFNQTLLKPFDDIKLSQLTELIQRMLKTDPEERITAKSILEHPFLQDFNYDKHCEFKPEEKFYIPFLSQNTYKGINTIRKHFQEKNNSLKAYFLAQHLYLSLLSRFERNISDSELLKYVNSCIKLSKNYYGEAKYTTTDEEHKIIKILDGKIGNNPFFMSASKVQYLTIIDNVLLKNPELIHFYTVLEPDRLFREYERIYDVKNIKILLEMDFLQFSKIDIPSLRGNYSPKNLAPSNYSLATETVETELDDVYEIYSEVEKSLRQKIERLIEKRLAERPELSRNYKQIEDIIKTTKLQEYYDELVMLKGKTASETLLQYINMNLGIIDTDDMTKLGLYNIIKSDDELSFLHIIKEHNHFIHYFTSGNDLIEMIAEDAGYIYKIGNYYNPGKIKELSMLVGVYTATELGYFDINMIRICDNTVKLFLLLLYVD